MACCKSMLARRVVLWYILLGSFVLFPLSFMVGLGCRFLNVGFENQDEVESFGAFSVAIYDPQTRGNNNFLGCVRPSQYWQEETSYDVGFMTLKIASGFMMAFSIAANLICICLQCFNKHGKSHLWGIMRVCYIGAAASQGVMYTVFISELCQSDEEGDDDSDFKGFLLYNLGDKKCAPGHTGILGVINFAFIFGMIVATFNSLPPRNPVFQCWGGDIDWDEDSEDGSNTEDDSEVKKLKSLLSEGDDSVSLFTSKSFRKASKSFENGDDVVSRAEKGISSKSVGSKCKKSSIPSAYEKYAIAEDIVEEVAEEDSVMESKTPKSEEEKVALEMIMSPAASSVKSKSKFPGVAKLFKRDKSAPAQDNESVASSKKNKPEVQIPSDGSLLGGLDLKTMSSNLSSVLSASSGTTLEITNFVIQLIEMTELEDGGRRVKIADVENQVEIVDEYPKVPGGKIETSDSDVAVVRTEFYDLGSRTIKTITHKDGSKTIVTTILVESGVESVRSSGNAKPPEYPQPLEPPVQMSYSGASIDSPNDSKYNVKMGPSSVTTYKGTGDKKEVLGQGDLALSVGTRSTKVSTKK